MRAKKYYLALVLGSLGLLMNQELQVAPAQADPLTPAQAKRLIPAKPAQRRAIRPDYGALLKPQLSSNRLPVVALPMPSRSDKGTQPRSKRGPYLDMEGLVILDMHVQPNIMFMTDTRYDNSSTRERAQRDEIDWLAARKNGECHQGEDAISKLIRAREEALKVKNDPGFGVAASANQQVLETPPKLPVDSAPGKAVAKPRPLLSRIAKLSATPPRGQ